MRSCDVGTHAGVATLVAIGAALCRHPNSRSFRLASSGLVYRWTVPAALPNVDRPTGTAATSTSKTTYRFPRQPIVASLVQARRLRDLARSLIGGLYGP
ncbi:MAG: hypothetical protein IID05_08610 [Gemmatimonadetes bacterium]|nr:hypothetical protein [Gemmatimonadota bacterium]